MNLRIFTHFVFYFFRSTMAAVPASCLEDVRPLALKACVIGIDEGQFVSLSILKIIYLFFGQNQSFPSNVM